MSRALPAILFLASAGSVIPEFFKAGFTHILPGGLDHILFILGLFFLNRSPGVLLFQMTLFTLAHSLTLGLSLYGFLPVPPRLVETGTALAIVLVAGGNLFRERFGRWRPWVVSVSGLIHGMGLAHSFGGAELEGGDFIPAMFSFNLGIGAGQLAAVGLAYLAVAPWWGWDFYQKKVARPVSMGVALIGTLLVVRSVVM